MNTLRAWMVRIGHWLIVFGTEPATTPTLPVLAKRLVDRMNEQWPDTDGEFKRHQVLGQLINTFPNVRKREISQAIEDAL